MDLKNFVVISGLPGVYRMLGNRKNGLIVEDIDSSKRKFVSARQHQFTPLESISIYTDGGNSVPLTEVFGTMQDKKDDLPIPEGKYDGKTAFGYLGEILPNYDKDQVFLGDVKKLIKWFSFLEKRDLLKPSEEETTEESIEETKEEQAEEKE